ncbi:hypothetical protein S2E19_03957 [Bacillus mycoides]|nr:hypothetical protein bmyco0001_56630 [Bacillus mycoides DSM 2048]OSY02479.1 hypothetical protein S2E19_03957 [Bacillus mycoides]
MMSLITFTATVGVMEVSSAETGGQKGNSTQMNVGYEVC